MRRSRALGQAGLPAHGENALENFNVRNLPFTATDDQISQLVGQHGTMHMVALINDRETGGLFGFGFVEVDATTRCRR
jgi:RNA recognition motif-containing protein